MHIEDGQELSEGISGICGRALIGRRHLDGCDHKHTGCDTMDLKASCTKHCLSLLSKVVDAHDHFSRDDSNSNGSRRDQSGAAMIDAAADVRLKKSFFLQRVPPNSRARVS